MIPLKDNIRSKRFPVVCVTLIVLNVIIFLVDKLTGHYELAGRILTDQGIVEKLIYIPRLSGHYSLVPNYITSNFTSYWPTVFTSMFLHANWLHIGGNMLYLYIFGNNVEDTLGRFRFLLFYLLCGIGAAMAQIYIGPDSMSPMVGASGAIAGVMGAYLILFPKADILSIVPIFIISTIMDVPAVVVIGYWALMNYMNARWLGSGDMMQHGGVAYYAHLGGFATGLLLILLLGGKRLLQKKRAKRNDYIDLLG